MNCYFDTSIYNHILDDPKKELIIEIIKSKRIRAIPSVVNLCEILFTPDKDRKQRLLNIYNEIRDDYHALKPFTELLRDATMGVQKNEDEMKVNMPIPINGDTKEICEKALSNAGEEFDKYALKARDWVFTSQGKKKLPDAKTFFEISDDENMRPTWIKLFRGACDGLGIKELSLNEETIMRFITDINSPWKYYLDTTLLIFYRRALSTAKYGRKTNPGGADLQQGIYLCWADIFVIKDGRFYEFMKELKSLRNYNKKIFTHDEFKDFLGIG